MLRQNSVELRELERQLKAAYGAKELKVQMAQREALKLQEKVMLIYDIYFNIALQCVRMNVILSSYKVRDRAIYETMKTGWSSEAELYQQKLAEDMCKKEQYKQELQDQMICKEKNKRFLYEEFLREKKMLDEIVERISLEDER